MGTLGRRCTNVIQMPYVCWAIYYASMKVKKNCLLVINLVISSVADPEIARQTGGGGGGGG